MDLSTLISNINGKDFAKAQVIFDDMMNAKVTDALDKEKVKLAGQLFNGDPENDEDLVDEVEGDEDAADDAGDEVEATEGEDPEDEGEAESSDSEEESGEDESEPEDEVEDEKVQGD